MNSTKSSIPYRSFRRRRPTDFDRRRQDLEGAMQRATQGHSMVNYPAIIAGFAARGIPEEDIRPRENVFTYQLWQQLGRQVRKGEHGVKITSLVPVTRRQEDPAGGELRDVIVGRRTVTATVFHISQTDLIASAGTDPANDHRRVPLTSIAAALPEVLTRSVAPTPPVAIPSVEAQVVSITDRAFARRPAWLDRFKTRTPFTAVA